MSAVSAVNAVSAVSVVNVVNLVNEATGKDMASTRSSLGRRRSEKEGPVPSPDSQDVSEVWHWKSSRKHPATGGSEKPPYSEVPVVASDLAVSCIGSICMLRLKSLKR